MCPGGKCPWGKCPGGTCPFFCPVTERMTLVKRDEPKV